MAQLGARLNGIQKVRGSNPLISTKKKPFGRKDRAVFSFLCDAPLFMLSSGGN